MSMPGNQLLLWAPGTGTAIKYKDVGKVYNHHVLYSRYFSVREDDEK